MPDTPWLLRFPPNALNTGSSERWVALCGDATPTTGGFGVTIWSSAEIDTRVGMMVRYAPKSFAVAAREAYGLDSEHVPPEVAAAWMKFKHMGLLNASA